MTSCAKCNECVTAIPDSIKCSNSLCDAVYHARCVAIPRNFLKLITEMQNLFFYCDACSAAPPKVQVTPTTNVSEQFLSNQSTVNDIISGQLVHIQESINNLTAAIAKAPVRPTVNESAKTLKRRRVEGDDADVSVAFNTPQRATAKLNSVVVGSADENNDLQVVEPRKLLVASLFHPSTESDSLAAFLKGKLNIASETTEVRVHKLVRPGIDLATLDYVSFKVDVPGHLFNELLSSAMWPKGVRVREFEHRPRKPRTDAVFLPPAMANPPDTENSAM